MQVNGATLQALRADVEGDRGSWARIPDYVPVEKEAAAFKAAFATTLAYWKAHPADDAVKAAQDGAKVADQLVSIAKDKDYRELVAASMAMGETCASCHMAHRARLADGTFEIK